MPVRFSDMSNLTSPKAVVRLLEMLFACTAFSLATVAGGRDKSPPSQPFAIFAMFTWCFSFAATLLVFLVEFTQLHSLLAFSWKNLPITLAAFAALMNLAASVTYPLLVLSVAGPARASSFSTATTEPQAWSGLLCPYRIAATIASCLAFLAYSAELLISKAGGKGGYMASGPGLLKVLEVALPCLLAVTLVTEAYPHCSGLWWGLGALCACALMALVVIVMMVCECRSCGSLSLSRILLAFGSLAVLLQLAVLLAWSLHLVRHADWLAECSRMDCRRNLLVLFTALLLLNFLAYLADLAYSIKLNCSRS